MPRVIMTNPSSLNLKNVTGWENFKNGLGALNHFWGRNDHTERNMIGTLILEGGVLNHV